MAGVTQPTTPWMPGGVADHRRGGVLVNQAVYQIDLLSRLMGPIAELSGYWANLNHPTIDAGKTQQSQQSAFRVEHSAQSSLALAAPWPVRANPCPW